MLGTFIFWLKGKKETASWWAEVSEGIPNFQEASTDPLLRSRSSHLNRRSFVDTTIPRPSNQQTNIFALIWRRIIIIIIVMEFFMKWLRFQIPIFIALSIPKNHSLNGS